MYFPHRLTRVWQGLNISKLCFIVRPNHVRILIIKARIVPNWNLTFFNGSINISQTGGRGDIEAEKRFKQICKWIPARIDSNCVSPSVGLYIRLSFKQESWDLHNPRSTMKDFDLAWKWLLNSASNYQNYLEECHEAEGRASWNPLVQCPGRGG